MYVTHDHNEALILADLVAVMNRGRIEQVGTFQEIYDWPVNVFGAGFLNLHVDTPPLSLLDARQFPDGERLGDVSLGVRPENVEVFHEPRDGAIPGVVAHALALPMKDVTILQIDVGGAEVHARIAGTERHGRGDQVWVGFKRQHVFDRPSGVRLRTVERSLGRTPS